MSTDASVNTPSADTQVHQPSETSDSLADHPKFKELQEKYAAADLEAKQWKGRTEKQNEELKRLKTAFVGDEQPVQVVPEPATKSDLESVKQEIRWELKHEKEIEIANKGGKYDEYIQQGKTKQDALKLALFDEGITNTYQDQMRQAAAAAPSQGIDRTSHDSPIEGMPKAYYENLKAKGLDDASIREIVQNAQQRAAKRR